MSPQGPSDAMPAPTIEDVAKAAGVSMMTVSRHLRRLPNVAATTGKKIDAAIEALRYRPNPAVRVLMSSIRRKHRGTTTSNLAYLTFGSSTSAWKHHYPTAKIFNGAEAEASRQGYGLLPIWVEAPALDGPRCAQILESRGCQGCLISPVGSQSVHPLAEFPWERFTSVALGYSLTHPRLNVAASHQWHWMRTILQKLEELPPQRIGLILTGGMDQRVDGQWLSAFLYSMASNSRLLPPLLLPKQLKTEERERRLGKWCERHHPELVLCDEETAVLAEAKLGAKQAITFLRINIPEVHLPGGPSIVRDYVELGAVAVRLLVSQIILNQHGIPEKPVHHLLDPVVEERK